VRLLLACLLVFPALVAQPNPLPEFDAAYLAPTPEVEIPRINGVLIRGFSFLQGGPGSVDPGQLQCRHCSLEFLVRTAYEKPQEAFTGLGWMPEALFDLIAKVPQGTTEHESHLMLQQLLAERFHLTVHHVPRELHGLMLTAGNRPPNLPPAAGDAAPPKLYMQDCLFHFEADSTMAELAAWLSREEYRPVADRTGLPGRYHISFAWFPSAKLAGSGHCTPGHLKAGHDAVDAIRKLLGLKVASHKLPGDAIVVDSALETPIEN
jgi:uncharacterized protein (TIGR03435 family)